MTACYGICRVWTGPNGTDFMLLPACYGICRISTGPLTILSSLKLFSLSVSSLVKYIKLKPKVMQSLSTAKWLIQHGPFYLQSHSKKSFLCYVVYDFSSLLYMVSIKSIDEW